MIFGVVSFDFAHLADTNTASIANRPRIGNPICRADSYQAYT